MTWSFGLEHGLPEYNWASATKEGGHSECQAGCPARAVEVMLTVGHVH